MGNTHTHTWLWERYIMSGTTGFTCCCQGPSFSDLVVKNMAFHEGKKQPSSLCPNIFLLEYMHREVWAVSSGLKDTHWASQINKWDIITHYITEANCSYVYPENAEKLCLTEIYSLMSHHHHFFGANLGHFGLKKQKGKKSYSSHSLSNTRTLCTDSGIDGKKCIGFIRVRIQCVFKWFNKERNYFTDKKSFYRQEIYL